MSLESLLERQTRARAAIRSRLSQAVSATWEGLGSWNDADVERFVARVTPLVVAGQVQTSAMTDAYIAATLSEMRGRPVRPVGPSRAEITSARGVPADEVYRRPFVEVWTALAAGVLFTDALEQGADRLLRLVDDDLSLAHRTSARASFTAAGVSRYRRVIRPELASTKTCGLCISAAAQTYSSSDLLPCHTRCGCEVGPAEAGDPFDRFNQDDISSVYTTPDAAELAKVRFQVNDHGELGPVLSVAGDHFAGPGDIA